MSTPSGAFDARHVFNANALYELPFGPGKAFLNQAGALRAILGLWSLSTNFTARTGFPVNLTTSATGPDGNTVDQRPNLVPGQPLYLAGGNFNPAAFCAPGTSDPLYPVGLSPAGFGDVPRNFLRGPGAWQMDLGLSKRIPVTERLQLQFRAEAFNIFNRAMLASPDGLVSASDFGVIYSLLNTTPVGMGTPAPAPIQLETAVLRSATTLAQQACRTRRLAGSAKRGPPGMRQRQRHLGCPPRGECQRRL